MYFLFRFIRLYGIYAEEVADMGRMSNVMPVLQFIAKEIHVSSVDFKEVLNESQLHCYNPT